MVQLLWEMLFRNFWFPFRKTSVLMLQQFRGYFILPIFMKNKGSHGKVKVNTFFPKQLSKSNSFSYQNILKHATYFEYVSVYMNT